jgi:hypothetical protein
MLSLIKARFQQMYLWEKILHTSLLSITFSTAVYLALSLFHFTHNVKIKVVSKFSQVENKNTVYLIQSEQNKIYALGFDLLSSGNKNTLKFNEIKENSCYLASLQGFESNPLQRQYITDLKEELCSN